jgi:hypothetical protein
MALTPTSSKTRNSTSGDAGASSRRLSGAVALGGVVLLCAFTGVVYYYNQPEILSVRPVATSAVAEAPVVVPKKTSTAWKDLTPAEQDALNPLAGEWTKLDTTRKSKWVAIADRFPQMQETERQRTQDRMREWVRLSPEQRRIARDTYLRAHAMPPEKRAELLAKYQQLPDEEKEQLTALSKEHKSVLPVKPHGKQEPVPNKDQIREGSAQKMPGLMAAHPVEVPATPKLAEPALPAATQTTPSAPPLPAGASPAPSSALPVAPSPAPPQPPGAQTPVQPNAQPGGTPAASGPASSSTHP